MPLEILPVDGRRGTARFIDAAWKVQQRPGSLWIPPLRIMVSGALNRRSNPFYKEGDRGLFLALRDGKSVGRIAAIENRRHNQYFSDRAGFFGFFECEDDAEAAAGLFEAAGGWLASRGLDSIRGPVNPSMHDELGLLVDGFDTPPKVMTPWNPPYYGPLVESAGLAPLKDLLGFDLPIGNELPIPESVRRLAERKRDRSKLKFRIWNMKSFEAETRRAHGLYCESWKDQWGFVPPSWEEFWHIAKDLKSVLHPEFAFLGEVDGELVGFMMIARDLNNVLKQMPSGRLWPWNLARLPFLLNKTMSGRMVLLGFKEEFQNRGYFPLFVLEVARRGLEYGAEGAEASWILEENEALLGPIQAMGFSPYKRWRLYEKALT